MASSAAPAVEEDSWVVVDKGGNNANQTSDDSLYYNEEDGTTETVKSRLHLMEGSKSQMAQQQGLAPELLEWINNSANSNKEPTSHRNSSASKSSQRTNNSSAGSQNQAAGLGRKPRRRSSIHALTEVSNGLGYPLPSSSQIDLHNEGMFVVKIVEVRQTGATRPMNLQCVAQVGEERFVLPNVVTKPTDYNVWSAKLDDTFVFDVSRQFTFKLSVQGAAAITMRGNTLPSRLSLASRRHVGRHPMVGRPAGDSNLSLLSTAASTTRTKGKLRAGLRKIFRKGDAIANDPTYTGCPFSPISEVTTPGAESECDSLANDDGIQTSEATDVSGRRIQVQRHSMALSGLESLSDLQAALPSSTGPTATIASAAPEIPMSTHPILARRLAAMVPRSRTSTMNSGISEPWAGRGRTTSTTSTASGASSSTFLYGVGPQPLGELYLDQRVERREKRRATFILPAVNADQEALRGGRRVEVAVVLEYGIIVHETGEEKYQRELRERAESEAAQERERRMEAERVWAAIDEEDRMARLQGYTSMFTRNGRVATWRRYWTVLSRAHIELYERPKDEEPLVRISLLHLIGAGVPASDLVQMGPTGIELRLSPLAMTDRHRRTSTHPRRTMNKKELQDPNRTLTSYPSGEMEDWLCRVYLLLDNTSNRDKWLSELSESAVAMKAALERMEQRQEWKSEEMATTKESLRLSGTELRMIQPKDTSDTLVEQPRKSKKAKPPMAALAFGKSTTFSMAVAAAQPPARKKVRARRRSSSVADLRAHQKFNKNVVEESDNESAVVQVVGKAGERRPGTISRRFLFVWNSNDV